MKLKINQKIITIIVLIIFILGGLSTVVVYHQVTKSLFTNEKESLVVATEKQSKIIENVLTNGTDLVKTASQNPIFVDYLRQANPKPQSDQILSTLSSYNIGNKFSAIYILDKNGQTLVSTDPTFVGKNYSFRDYFSESNLDRVFIDMSIGVTSKLPGYYFSYPVYDQLLHKQLGVIVFKMIPEAIHSNIYVSQNLQNIKLHFIDKYGVILFSSQPDKIYKSLGVLSKDSQKQISDKKTFSDLDITPLSYQVIQDDLSNISNIRDYQIEDVRDGQNEILIIEKIANSPFYILLEVDTHHLIKPAQNISLTISLFVALAAIIAIFAISFSLRKILLPIKIINQTSQKIVSGDLTQRVDIKTGDEFESLSQNFNDVTKKLINTNQNIQKKIDEKTADLQSINRFMVNRELKMIELKKQIKKLQKNEN